MILASGLDQFWKIYVPWRSGRGQHRQTRLSVDVENSYKNRTKLSEWGYKHLSSNRWETEGFK